VKTIEYLLFASVGGIAWIVGSVALLSHLISRFSKNTGNNENLVVCSKANTCRGCWDCPHSEDN
jgi:hypothetical protein